jgi:hypothetical protein
VIKLADAGLRFRRYLALVLMLAYGASAAEAVVGAVRDGSVHHESTVAAATHQADHHGEHGHEDPGAQPDHGSAHQHGTSGDHCTHTHGVSLPSACDFEVVTRIASAPEVSPLLRTGTTHISHFRPPKA